MRKVEGREERSWDGGRAALQGRVKRSGMSRALSPEAKD